MKRKNNLKLAKEWFKIGEEELKFAQVSFKEFDSFYPQICFQCQQAVEKYLKGFLIYHGKKLPKIHDLVELIKLCSKIEKGFEKFLEDGAFLSQYYIRSRYPVEYPSATKEETEKCLEIAERIINFIKTLI
jgi:HEPN domain-containing protein